MGLMNNLLIDLRHVGLTGLLSSGITKCSGSRLDLFAKNIAQVRIPKNGGDFPDMFTGFESMFGEYCFNSTERDNEIKVIAIIDKYALKISHIRAGSNPMRTIIYRDMKTGEISYFNVNRWTSYSNDYGYENIMKTNIQVNDVIAPDKEIYSSPAKDDDLYMIGVNANVAFNTLLETTEDCILMSESLADRIAPMSIETKSIVFDMKKYPLNCYGNDEVYRIIPDIGDVVNPDGILCAFRPVTKFSTISDLMAHKLTKINHIFDQKIYAHPGAKVVDIEVYLDSKSELPTRVYEQLKIYHEARMDYWKKIIDVYEQVKTLPLSHKFNTLVTRALGRLVAAKQPIQGIKRQTRVMLTDKFNPITLRIDITLAHKVTVNNGHKVSGRDGAKGVIKIKPDSEMPVDEQGFRADLCIDLISVVKRTNDIQFYEQYINRVLKWQAMNLESVGTIEQQFGRIVEVLNDINPEYARLIVEQHPTYELREQYVAMCKADTIKVCIPPSVDSVDQHMVQRLREKYNTPISPVEFTVNTSTGKKRVRSKEPMCIGSKYIYLLSKYPKPLASGFGYVNKCHMPVDAKDKDSAPIGTKPIRFGESESRIFAATTDISTLLRLRCLYSGSRIGPKMMIESLMSTAHPSQLKRVPVETDVLYNDNTSIRVTHNMIETCGIDLQNTVISEHDAEAIFESLPKK